MWCRIRRGRLLWFQQPRISQRSKIPVMNLPCLQRIFFSSSPPGKYPHHPPLPLGLSLNARRDASDATCASTVRGSSLFVIAAQTKFIRALSLCCEQSEDNETHTQLLNTACKMHPHLLPRNESAQKPCFRV